MTNSTPSLTLSLFGHKIAVFNLHNGDPLPMAKVTATEAAIGTVACFQANDALLALSAPLVRAAIGHEFGHLALGHNDLGRVEAGSDDYLLREAQADVYSAARLGAPAMFDLLGHLHTALIVEGDDWAADLIAQRIDLLKIAVEGEHWASVQLHVSKGAGTGRNERAIPGRKSRKAKKNRRPRRKGRR